MLLWEIDRPLSELAQLYNFEKAVRCYRSSHHAARGLVSLVTEHGIACQMRPRLSLYLAVDDSPKLIKDEFALRSRADLPSLFLDHAELLHRFGIARAPFCRGTRPMPIRCNSRVVFLISLSSAAPAF
jgi:hypothetical protein